MSSLPSVSPLRNGSVEGSDHADRMFLREESPVDECLLSVLICLMNIIIWNCRCALKPFFQNRVRELIQDHNPAILVVMETLLDGERARKITDRLPFDGTVHTDTIGYADGL